MDKNSFFVFEYPNPYTLKFSNVPGYGNVLTIYNYTKSTYTLGIFRTDKGGSITISGVM